MIKYVFLVKFNGKVKNNNKYVFLVKFNCKVKNNNKYDLQLDEYQAILYFVLVQWNLSRNMYVVTDQAQKDIWRPGSGAVYTEEETIRIRTHDPGRFINQSINKRKSTK